MGIQTASWLIPMTTILPKPFLRRMIWSVSWFDDIIDEDIRQTYDAPLFEYAFDYLSNSNGSVDDFFFVGHSLGGALAQIVAAQLHGLQKHGHLEESKETAIRSFAFNSPGLLLNSRKFSVNIDDLYETATIIDSEHDVVGDVDEHVGMVQDIDCVFEDVIGGCHRIMNAVCTLLEHCDATQSHNPDLLQLFCEYSEENPGVTMTDVYYEMEFNR